MDIPVRRTPPAPREPSLRPTVSWSDDGKAVLASWLSAQSRPFPGEVAVVGDGLSADRALRLARRGVGMLWRGDYRNALQVLHAMRRRLERRRRPENLPLAESFRRHRKARAHQARLLGTVLVELGSDYAVRAAHAPDVRQACQQVYGPPPARAVVSLRELSGVIGAHQWRRRGIPVPALGARIHPHYGVFAPTRADYLSLFAATAPPAAAETAFDVGTGTGVLAALLVRAGVPRVVATDNQPRAVACARENIQRLGMADRVEVVQADLFPRGRADLVVCNPPWVPGTPTSALESGVFDPGGGVLRRLLLQLPEHLAPSGQAWLVLSNLPELLGLRPPGRLAEMIDSAGLSVRERISRPAQVSDTRDLDALLSTVRAEEVITLWRLSGRTG